MRPASMVRFRSGHLSNGAREQRWPKFSPRARERTGVESARPMKRPCSYAGDRRKLVKVAQNGLPEDVEDEPARFDKEEPKHAPRLVVSGRTTS